MSTEYEYADWVSPTLRRELEKMRLRYERSEADRLTNEAAARREAASGFVIDRVEVDRHYSGIRVYGKDGRTLFAWRHTDGRWVPGFVTVANKHYHTLHGGTDEYAPIMAAARTWWESQA